MGAAEVIAFEEVRARKQWDTPQLSQDGPSPGPRPRRTPEALTAPTRSGRSRPRDA
jgi:hypothetical protein